MEAQRLKREENRIKKLEDAEVSIDVLESSFREPMSIDGLFESDHCDIDHFHFHDCVTVDF